MDRGSLASSRAVIGLTAVLAAVLATAPAMGQRMQRVVTATVIERPLPATMTLVGTVEPATRSVIGAEVAGLVRDMPARQGDLLRKGDLICKLNDDVLTLQRAREAARLAALQAQLDELVNGTRPEEILRLKAELDEATAMATMWSFEMDRVKRLQGGEYSNEKEYQDALARQQAALARKAARQAAHDEGIAGARAEAIAGARADVAEQQAVVERVARDLAKTEIRAPFDGHVVSRFVEVGNWVPVGGRVVELADQSHVLIRVDAPESAIPYATVGSTSTAWVDALEKRYTGKVKHVIPQADRAARTFPVEIDVANEDFALKSGMFCRATILAGPSTDVAVVPKDALIESRGQIYVALIVPGEEGHMAMPVPVSLGADDGDWIAIKSEKVSAGGMVATYGNERLIFPQPVAVVASRVEVDRNPPVKDPRAMQDGAEGSGPPKG